MARLSLKGIISLSHQLIKDGKTNTHNVELVQDDFEDCVMLTIEEAKRLVEHLRLCEVSVNDPFYASDCDAWALDLSYRIDQVEEEK